MTNLTTLTAAELAAAIASGDTTSVAATQAHLDRIADVEGAVKAYLTVDADGALAQAEAADKARAEGTATSPLAGVPVAVKDNIVTKGLETTAASRVLEGWVPPYDAHVVEKLRAAGLPILGKTNLDEFAMGASTEMSGYGPTHNPWDLDRVPGGSGGGSAAAVAAYEAPIALGTDTGGSIRQPASFTGTVGVKPTYGAVSRYGAIAMGSSLDQIGPASRTVLDAALLQDVIGGHDQRDQTSLPEAWASLADAARAGQQPGSIKGLRIGIPRQVAEGDAYEDEVARLFQQNIDLLKELGAEVTWIDTKSFEYAVAAYYILMPSEVSSNLARYDSVRYGVRVTPEQQNANVERVMSATRAAALGPEVKRRIVLGTYTLSSGYYDAYYGSAQKVRTLVQNDFADAFKQVDVLFTPTALSGAKKFGELTEPKDMYTSDLTSIPANLAGVPAISLPGGLAGGLPVGMQFMAPAREDARLYQVSAALEQALEAEWGKPFHTQVPELASAVSKESNR
ncbi:Asp-tRNA(Asn)/Glu-tRNA(Gln) amidotransferase subunit GatA [Gulosibacter chungangensis]|uniref:Glutamyl-tRNA(Gln) amidotransferase subunit A n=1 Tax=Gulosibacter chungangensis TaxID=979746 RepID=A0A7J5BA66_9MICO|nr:Asp-tRNA(Asn)/Glu-tRNA(Gln) amidotransferase subunit GatA [Gulosibacter chungangensis]KAB1642680.1 Asp-tRNA(Asn)/Glu-tRNA(Gln) amidotransferase subunit GatA [Gulosibacter chungangensis]